MTGTRLREFKVIMNDADLRACDRASVVPGELVSTSVRAALDALIEPSEEAEPEAAGVAESPAWDADEEEEPEDDEG